MHSLFPTLVRFLLSSFYWSKGDPEAAYKSTLSFSLRHEHALSDDLAIVFANVPPSLTQATTYTVDTRPVDLHRPSACSTLSRSCMPLLRQRRAAQSPLNTWDSMRVRGPEVERRETLLQLAKMTYNAYASGPENSSEWYELGSEWNTVRSPCVQLVSGAMLMISVVFGPKRVVRLGGSLMRMGSVAKCLFQTTSRRSWSPSRARRQGGYSVVGVPRPGRTS
jgi:hypothetical protein